MRGEMLACATLVRKSKEHSTTQISPTNLLNVFLSVFYG